MKKIVGILTCCAMLLCTSSAFAAADYIDIGDASSESGVCAMTNALEPQTRVVDGVTHTYRRLDKDGSMVVTMKCDPKEYNYLTVKLWGGDTGNTILWVCDPSTGFMNTQNNRPPSRNGGGVVDRRDWVELNSASASPQYDGGFIYSTYLIPKVYTKDKTSVKLKIYSTGSISNYGDSAGEAQTQTEPSRGIYAVYMTQDACFDPEEFETVTGALNETAAIQTTDYTEQKNIALQYSKNAVDIFKSWQIYGADNYPSYMEGMVTRGTAWQRKRRNDSDWKNAYYKSSGGMLQQNVTPLDMYEIFALAYVNSDAFGYSADEKTEFLDRIVKGVDFLVRAQGANGGFYSNDGWIGGPARRAASGNNLTGFGLRSVGEAILLTYDDISTNGYFNEEIDSDADGKTDKNRLSAWADMLASARDYLTSLDGAGHAPNQDMADIIAALRFEKSLQLMDSDKSWKARGKESEIAKQLDIALGLEPSIACSSYWVSPKGLILENFGSVQGGYSGDYGTNALEEMSQLAEFAEAYYGKDSREDKKYRAIIDRAYNAVDSFMFTANAGAKSEPTLYAEGITSNRNSYYPGTVRYVNDYYAAIKRKNKTSLKNTEYFLNHNRLERGSEEYTPSNAHFEDNALGVMRLYLHFDEYTNAFEEQHIADYDYKMQDDSVTSYAWADEMARNVVIKNGDDKIYLALNWRNPVHSQSMYNTAESTGNQRSVMNNLARVHHINNSFDRYGYAALETEGFPVMTATSSDWTTMPNHYVEAFMYMKYGDYAILMNSASDTDHEFKVDKLGLVGEYRDMISGGEYTFEGGETITVPYESTLVLYPKTDEPQPTDPPSPKELTLTGAEYDGETVTADIASSGKAAVKVFAAEYDDNKLINVKLAEKGIDGGGTVSIDIRKTVPENSIKLFVWDEEYKPVGESRKW